MEYQTQHDPHEHHHADAAGAPLIRREWQRQHHHHQQRKRIDQLVPHRNFVACALLLVLFQVLGIFVQIIGRHLLRHHQHHTQDTRRQRRLPVLTRRGQGGYTGLVKARLKHVSQQPFTRLNVACTLGAYDRLQVEGFIEIINVDIRQTGVGHHAFDVHETVAILDPDAGTKRLQGNLGIHCLEAQFLCHALGWRRQKLTTEKTDDNHRQRNFAQRAQHLHGRCTGSAVDRHLGTRRHLHQRQDGADQHRHRKQLVNMPRDGQRHENQHIAQAVFAVTHHA